MYLVPQTLRCLPRSSESADMSVLLLGVALLRYSRMREAGPTPVLLCWDEKRAHGKHMRTYSRPAALLLRSTRIENFVGAHPSLMRAFAGLDLQQPSVIQSEATVREQSVESRHEHG